MKKLLICLLALSLVVSLAACGGSGSSSSESSVAPAESSTEEVESDVDDLPDEAPSEVTGDEDDGVDVQPEGAITSVDDLVGKTIGVQQGTTGDIYSEDIEGATVERFLKGAEAVMALQQGKVDAVVIDDQPAKAFAALNDDIMVLEEPFTVEDYAICVSKDNAELTAAMNGAIAELKADGTLQSILDYYIGDVEGASPYSSPEGQEYPNGKLTMGTNAAFPPYEYWEDGEIRGVDADFARAICDKLGYELEIEDMNFDAIITAVISGKADFGAAGMTVTEDRLRNIDFTDSYCTASQVVIVKK